MKELQGPEQGTANCNESHDSIVYTNQLSATVLNVAACKVSQFVESCS